MSISPQGYTLGGDPQNINPFWGEDEQTNWTIEAEATVDNTSGSPSVNVETETDSALKKKTFTFEFSGLKGADGTNGVGITSIAKTGTSGLVDTYTITFTNGTTTIFTVTNGTSGTDGDDGVGISSIQKTGTSGLVDTYTITLTNGETDTFTVTNGSNGTTPVITITATEGGTPITVTKTGTDAAPSFNFAFTGGGGSGSTVSVTQIQSTGTKIATITVDGVGTDLYAPEGGSGGLGLVVNKSDFTSIVGKVVNKLRCTFENAQYYIQQIPYIKVTDGTTGSMQITAGAGILYFDNMEFNAVSSQVWGHGFLRVVVPNSGGEYDFQGLMSLQCTDENSIDITLGRGILTHSSGIMYFTNGGSSSFSINKTTSSVSGVYAEVI